MFNNVYRVNQRFFAVQRLEKKEYRNTMTIKCAYPMKYHSLISGHRVLPNLHPAA